MIFPLYRVLLLVYPLASLKYKIRVNVPKGFTMITLKALHTNIVRLIVTRHDSWQRLITHRQPQLIYFFYNQKLLLNFFHCYLLTKRYGIFFTADLQFLVLFSSFFFLSPRNFLSFQLSKCGYAFSPIFSPVIWLLFTIPQITQLW